MAKKDLENKIKERLNSLTKPKESLGFLEAIALKIGKIQGKVLPKLPEKKAVFVFAGDHGVTEEGVSAYPKEVTAQMVLNFLNGGAAINVFSRHVGSEVYVVDAGVDYDFPAHERLLNKKVGKGTKNFSKEPAMSREEAEKSIEYGKEIARFAKEKGFELVAVGDMGIGNTTTATAIAVALGHNFSELIDIGTVITGQQLKKKEVVVKQAISIHEPFMDPIDVLSKVGSYCLGEMAGFMLECAQLNIPVVIDGFPTTAAALIAAQLNPEVVDCMFSGHRSKVKGHRVLLDALNLRPILDLDMRLGEGTGAVLSFSIIEAAIKMINEMATFDDANVSKGKEK